MADLSDVLIEDKTTRKNNNSNGNSLKTVPVGTYNVVISQAERVDRDSTTTWIKMAYTVIDHPKHNGFKFHNVIMLRHQNAKSVAWGREICRKIWNDALGESGVPANSDSLLGRKMTIDTVIDENQYGLIQNIIATYSPYALAQPTITTMDAFTIDEE